MAVQSNSMNFITVSAPDNSNSPIGFCWCPCKGCQWKAWAFVPTNHYGLILPPASIHTSGRSCQVSGNARRL